MPVLADTRVMPQSLEDSADVVFTVDDGGDDLGREGVADDGRPLEEPPIGRLEPVDTGDGYIPGAIYSSDWYKAHVAADMTTDGRTSAVMTMTRTCRAGEGAPRPQIPVVGVAASHEARLGKWRRLFG